MGQRIESFYAIVMVEPGSGDEGTPRFVGPDGHYHTAIDSNAPLMGELAKGMRAQGHAFRVVRFDRAADVTDAMLAPSPADEAPADGGIRTGDRVRIRMVGGGEWLDGVTLIASHNGRSIAVAVDEGIPAPFGMIGDRQAVIAVRRDGAIYDDVHCPGRQWEVR